MNRSDREDSAAMMDPEQHDHEDRSFTGSEFLAAFAIVLLLLAWWLS